MLPRPQSVLKIKALSVRFCHGPSWGFISYLIWVVIYRSLVLRRSHCNSNGMYVNKPAALSQRSLSPELSACTGNKFRTANQKLCFRVTGMSQRVNSHPKPNGCLLWDESEINFCFISVMLRELFILLVF